VKFFPSTGIYMNPVAVFTALAGFYVMRIFITRMPPFIEKVVLFLSPSMFGVYLVHACGLWQLTFAPQSVHVDVLWALCRTFELFILGIIIARANFQRNGWEFSVPRSAA